MLSCANILQVHVYLPEADHPAKGTVRAILKDNADTYVNTSSQIWLDSGAYQLLITHGICKSVAAHVVVSSVVHRTHHLDWQQCILIVLIDSSAQGHDFKASCPAAAACCLQLVLQ